MGGVCCQARTFVNGCSALHVVSISWSRTGVNCKKVVPVMSPFTTSAIALCASLWLPPAHTWQVQGV